MTQRIFWQRPQLRTDEDQHIHRRVGWLELFYDLVFVVVISELAHNLAADVTLTGVGQFVLLFMPVWWLWIGGTYYNERFETEGVDNRLFTFLQMLPVAGMATFAHYGTSKTSVQFALSYAAARILLTYLWGRAGYHDRRFAPTARRFVAGFSVAIALFLISTLVPPPQRFILWGLGLLIDLGTPVLTIRHQSTLPRFSTSHLPERFGLFILIVLGESIIGVVQGLAAKEELSLFAGLSGVLGMALSFGLWWVYFDYVARRPFKPGTAWSFAWGYLHLPLVMTLTATGAGILNVIANEDAILPDPVRLLIAASVGCSVMLMALLELTLHRTADEPTHPRLSPLLKGGVGTVAIAIGFLGQGLSAIALLILLLALLAILMGYGLLVWFRPHPV